MINEIRGNEHLCPAFAKVFVIIFLILRVFAGWGATNTNINTVVSVGFILNPRYSSVNVGRIH